MNVIYSTLVILDGRSEFNSQKAQTRYTNWLTRFDKGFQGGSVLVLQNAFLSLSMVLCHPTQPCENLWLRFGLCR